MIEPPSDISGWDDQEDEPGDVLSGVLLQIASSATGRIYDLCRCREHPTYGQFPPSVAGMEHLHRLYDPLLKWTLYPDFPMRKPFWSLKDLLHIQFSFDKYPQRLKHTHLDSAHNLHK